MTTFFTVVISFFFSSWITTDFKKRLIPNPRVTGSLIQLSVILIYPWPTRRYTLRMSMYWRSLENTETLEPVEVPRWVWSERCTKTVHLEILARRSLLTTIFQTQFIDSLWRRANAQNVSFSISVRWAIYIFTSVDKPNFRVSFRQLWYIKAVRERRANCPWQARSLSSTHFLSVLLWNSWGICFKRQSFSSISSMRYVHSDAHCFEFYPYAFLKQPKVCLFVPKESFFFRSYLHAVNGKSENRWGFWGPETVNTINGPERAPTENLYHSIPQIVFDERGQYGGRNVAKIIKYLWCRNRWKRTFQIYPH